MIFGSFGDDKKSKMTALKNKWRNSHMMWHFRFTLGPIGQQHRTYSWYILKMSLDQYTRNLSIRFCEEGKEDGGGGGYEGRENKSLTRVLFSMPFFPCTTGCISENCDQSKSLLNSNINPMNWHEYLILSCVPFCFYSDIASNSVRSQVESRHFQPCYKKDLCVLSNQLSVNVRNLDGQRTQPGKWFCVRPSFLPPFLLPLARPDTEVTLHVHDLVHVHCWLTNLSKRYTVLLCVL